MDVFIPVFLKFKMFFNLFLFNNSIKQILRKTFFLGYQNSLMNREEIKKTFIELN